MTFVTFKAPLASLVNWKIPNISWANGPDGKVTEAFAYNSSVDEPTGEIPQGHIHLPGRG